MIEKTLKKAIGLAFMICLLAVSAIPVFAEQTDRHLEVTVVKGNSFTNFMNLPVDVFVLYRYSEATDTWEPIPFQIDELDGGKVYGTGTGLLDPSDEIVLMAR